MATNELAMVLTVPDDATASGFTRLRVYGTKDRPVWVASDLAAVFKIKNIRQNMASLEADEKGVCRTYTLGGSQEVAVVNEAGLYKLIFASRTPEAKRFQRWVVWEVLPSIRQHGCYPPPVNAEGGVVSKNDTDPFLRMMAEISKSILALAGAVASGQKQQADHNTAVMSLLSQLVAPKSAPPVALPPVAVSEPGLYLAVPSKQKVASIRDELIRDPHRVDLLIVDVLAETHRLRVDRRKVSELREEMERTREIEPSPKRRRKDGSWLTVKYDTAQLPFHTTVDDLDAARPTG